MSKLAHSHRPSMDQIEADAMEREANQFAMELLMPTEFMKIEMAKLGHFDIEDGKAIEALAKKFKVSVPLMTLRVGQLLERGL